MATELRAPFLLTGGEAAAHAMRQIDPDVVPIYPITPQTPIIQAFARFAAEGRVDSELINVESEHSAMSAAIGAALAGGRTMTATSSQGLALMIEVVYIAASLRAPIVMALATRALSGPINIHCDHADAMLARDAGVVQLFAENAQEAYDLTLIAPRLAEHPNVRVPVVVCQDGFTTTHSAEPVVLVDDELAKNFVGEYAIPYPLLDSAQPTTQGPFAMPDYYFELKYQQAEAVQAALEVFPALAADYAELSKREYGLVETYRLDDADHALVMLGSTAGTAKDVVDGLRADGERVGLLRLVAYRPFPARTVWDALRDVRRAIVLDRALSPGTRPPLYSDLATTLYGSDVELVSHVYGLGGRDLHPADLRAVVRGEAPAIVGLREEPCLG